MNKYITPEFLENWRSGKSQLIETVIAWSYEQPRKFWEELFYHLSDLKNKSILFQSYDFYADLVLRHLGKKRVAYKSWENGAFKEWTYDQIHRCVNFQLHRLKSHGLQAGQKVAVVMQTGIHCVVTLLTLLRMGLRFIFLPSDSPILPSSRIETLLQEIEPVLTITTVAMPGKNHVIQYLEETQDSPGSFVYSPHDTIEDTVSFYTQQEYNLNVLTAEEMYLSSLRDGFLSLDLKPEVTWFFPSSEYPSSLFTALFYGATCVHAAESNLLANPGLLEGESVDIISISPTLQNLWLHNPGLPKKHLKFWYKNPFKDNGQGWMAFVEKNKIEKVPMSQVFISHGGIALSSLPTKERIQEEVWPSLGTPWKLLQLNLSGAKSILPYGVFQQEKVIYNLILAQLKKGWVISGTTVPNKDGYTIPINTVEKEIETLDFVAHATLLTLPCPDSILASKTVLLIFTEPNYILQGTETKIVNELIKKTVGSQFIPETIEFYPFAPKMSDGKVNRNECLFQYTSGMLSRKKDLEVYQLINLLRRAIV